MKHDDNKQVWRIKEGWYNKGTPYHTINATTTLSFIGETNYVCKVMKDTEVNIILINENTAGKTLTVASVT